MLSRCCLPLLVLRPVEAFALLYSALVPFQVLLQLLDRRHARRTL